MNKEIIFIKLLNEGTEVWRPANATRLDNDTYRIDLSNTFDSEDEEWEFKPGMTVRCENRILSDQICLVATRLI
jgi:hypothetical protein